ncbi:MAG: amidohydrolase family protein [Patescibacteria group bacterium]
MNDNRVTPCKGYRYVKLLTACVFCFAILVPACYNKRRDGASNVLPIIDVHSQFDENVPVARVIEYAARAGVTQVLLSARGRATPAQVLDLGSTYPACIVPSVRTKGRAFIENWPRYYTLLDEQFKEPAFRAMSEIILVHAPKGKRAPEVNVAADTPQVKEAIQRAIAKGWPIVLHYEFRWLTNAYGTSVRAKRMAELKSLVSRYPHHPFALIHMAQLDASDAAALLAAHPNLVFLTSHANTLAINESRQPWTNMFADEELAPEWKALVLRHPDRFVLAFDNVWPEHWSEKYVQQVELWRKALGKLPDEVAHAVAHGNAERLWKLAPAMAGHGCGALKR